MTAFLCEWAYPEAPSPRRCRHCGRSEWDPAFRNAQETPPCPALSQRVALGETYNRERLIDEAVRRVMARGCLPQGYAGKIDVGRAYVACWLQDGARLNAWWFAFISHVQAEYRKIIRAAPWILDPAVEWGDQGPFGPLGFPP